MHKIITNPTKNRVEGRFGGVGVNLPPGKWSTYTTETVTELLAAHPQLKVSDIDEPAAAKKPKPAPKKKK